MTDISIGDDLTIAFMIQLNNMICREKKVCVIQANGIEIIEYQQKQLFAAIKIDFYNS